MEGDGGLHTYGKIFIFGITQKEESILQEIQSVLGFSRDLSLSCNTNVLTLIKAIRTIYDSDLVPMPSSDV